MKNANELNILNFNFSKDKLIHDYDLEYENNATFKKIASSLDLPKDTLIKETSKIIESSIEVDRCKKCKHLFECKNNVEGYVYYPINNNGIIEFCYIPCKYKKEIRISDFTLADCWRPNTVKSQLKDDDKGLSMIFVNTEKGKKLFEEIKDKYVVQEIDYDLAIKSQSAATSSVKPNIHRQDFFVKFSNNDFAYIDKNWYGNDIITNIKNSMIYKKTKLNLIIKR